MINLRSIIVQTDDRALQLLMFMTENILNDYAKNEASTILKVLVVTTNKQLLVSAAASLHAVLQSQSFNAGKIMHCDMLVCFTSIMMCVMGSGVLQGFWTRERDERPILYHLFSSTLDHFTRLYGDASRPPPGSKGKNDTLPSYFIETFFGANRNVLLQLQKTATSNGYATVKNTVADILQKMHTAKYFESKGWILMMVGRHMDAERMSWEIMATGVPTFSNDNLLPTRNSRYFDCDSLATMLQSTGDAYARDPLFMDETSFTTDDTTGIMTFNRRRTGLSPAHRKVLAPNMKNLVNGWRVLLPLRLRTVGPKGLVYRMPTTFMVGFFVNDGCMSYLYGSHILWSKLV